MKKTFKALLTVLAVAAGFAFTACSFNANSLDLAGNSFRQVFGEDEHKYYQYTFGFDGTYEFIISDTFLENINVKVYKGKYSTDTKLHLMDEKQTEYYILNKTTNKKENKTIYNDSGFHKNDFSVKYNFDGEKLIFKYTGWKEEYPLLRK